MNGTVFLLSILVGIVTLMIIILALTNRIIFKMAARNFTRRKAQSVIVIAGLMIGTAIISSALVVQDTMTNAFEVDVYYSLGEVDEEIWGINSFGTVAYFNESIYDTLSANLTSVPEIEALAPVISDRGSVLNLDTKLSDPSVAIMGLDSQVLRSTVFGDLDGSGFYPDSLQENEVAINTRLADDLEASEGDILQLSYGAKNPVMPSFPILKKSNLTIKKIIDEEDLYGKANYNLRNTMFFELGILQKMLNRPDEINYIWISNEGDYLEGEKYTEDVNSTIETELRAAIENNKELNLEVHNVKSDNLQAGREAGEGIGTLFMIFGTFAIIAGIVLIINIFVMLGEERKSEMGMARAVGMKSKHLVRMYLFEGSLYAFVAAIVGAFLGLFFGWVIIQAFEFIFGSLEDLGGSGFNIPFYYTWDSIFISFCLGLLITFVTIFFISRRITKLNIIRAIRRIPEPRTSGTKKRTHIYGLLFVIFGILFLLWGYGESQGAGWMIGLPFLFIGSALVLYKWISFRIVITIAGFLIIFFMIPPFDIPVMSDADYSGAEAFILSGVFLVLAGIFIVMFNSDILLKILQGIFGRGKSTRAVLKTAISYPMDNRFKTGMTLGMFALIIFTVTVIAMIASMQASQGDAMLIEQSGGYDIIGVTNARTPFTNLTKNNLPNELQNIEIEQLETMSQAVVTLLDYDQEEGQNSDYGPSTMVDKMEQYSLVGVSDSFLSNNGYTLMDRDPKFASDREAWEALSENSSYCIVDGNRLSSIGITIGGPPVEMGGVFVGGTIRITDFMGLNRTKELKVIGIMDQMFFIQGIFVKKDMVINEYGGLDNIMVLKLGPDEDADLIAKEFEKSYLDLGLQTFDLKGIINTILALSNNMMYLMEGFLGIGLLVGIAGIGIISYRNVLERRQQIGMLRAIGFKKSMITKSFLIETSFITILAIIIGLLLGIGIGWTIFKDSFEEVGANFVIPWMNLLAISLIAYITTLIFTFYPSIKASKIPPAEALRYIE
jgi:putative ABC transport system permease protein